MQHAKGWLLVIPRFRRVVPMGIVADLTLDTVLE